MPRYKFTDPMQWPNRQNGSSHQSATSQPAPFAVSQAAVRETPRSESDIHLDHLYAIFGRAVFLVVPRGSKNPGETGWEILTFEATQTPEYRKKLIAAIKLGGNIGVLLGPTSDGLHAIDIDRDDYVQAFLDLNPAFDGVTRTRGKKGCQIFFRLEAGTSYPNNKAFYPLKTIPGEKWGEWRCGDIGGAQSIIYGLHPDGMRYELVSDAVTGKSDFNRIKWPADVILPWKSEPRPAPQTKVRPPLLASIDKRIRAYLDTVKPAVEGEGGSDITFRVACTLVNDWALDGDQALEYLRSYSARCQPPWSEKELQHKIDDALGATHPKPRGCLRDAQPKTTTPPRRPRDDGDDWQEPAREPRKLHGHSILDYAERKIDVSKNLLGNRWLSRCCGAFVVAPSGHGKSTWVIQVGADWGCGRPSFGVSVPEPMRILIIQSEDDDNDVTEMAQGCDRLKLSQAEKALIRRNTHVEWLNDVSGSEFFLVLEDFLREFRPDIVIINPYSAYQGSDLRDDEANNKFLRGQLNRLLREYNCGAILIHHTPKTNFQNTDQYSWYDWMYTMAGGAALTNWARGILVISPTEVPGTYRFIVAKRFEKIGWKSREYWFAHSIENGKILWVPASADQITSAKDAKALSPEDVLRYIPKLDAISQSKFWELCRKAKVYDKKARHFVNVLIDDEKVFEWKLPRPNSKAAIGYSQSKPTNG